MKQPERIESWTKLLGVAVALAGLGFTGFQFFQTFSMNAKKPFLEKQMDFCIEASTIAATIASTAKNDRARSAAEARFWVLYWGPLGIVENTAVEHQMVCIGRHLSGNIKTGCNDVPLTQRSLRLAKACRDLMAESWGVSREALVGQKQN
ncbi:hypothetical protein [uncultured Jannaschia sp.]|uniref:hypothetical protein n=1 Tax=uncultured Jannaschia sp. TaxID=293347 RepID=UPI002617E66D|nr:hypothetical protein [uncultured Jannaschia sp.]